MGIFIKIIYKFLCAYLDVQTKISFVHKKAPADNFPIIFQCFIKFFIF